MHLLHRHRHHRSRIASAARGRASARAVSAVRLTPPPPPPSSSARLCSSSSSSKRRTNLLLIARATSEDDVDPDDANDDDIGPPPLPPPASPAALDAAALAAVDAFVKPGAVVGLGRGELVQRVVAAIGRRISEGKLGNVSVVPSAAASAASAAFHGVPIAASADNADAAPAPSPTVFFDEADQLDPQANAYLSGSRAGEAAHPDLPAICSLVERTIARGGEVVALPASAAACVPRLNAALPVALAGAGGATTSSSNDSANNDPSQAPLAAWEEAAEELDDIFLGDAELWRRPQDPRESANPRGGRAPLVQPDGSTLVDIRFYEGLCLFGEAEVDYERIQEEITSVSGVVATGLFVCVATAAIVPSSAGAAEGDEAIKPRMLVRGEGGALVEGAGAAAA